MICIGSSESVEFLEREAVIARGTDQMFLHSNIDSLPQASEARQQLAEAIASKNYHLASIYACEVVGLATRQQPARNIIQQPGNGAERLLRERSYKLLERHEESRGDR